MANKRRKYTPEFRRQMVEPVRAGRKFADLENEFGCMGGGAVVTMLSGFAVEVVTTLRWFQLTA